MQVEKRPHPRGERGVFSSLEEVAKRAAEGGVRPDVRRWAIEVIDKKRKTGKNVHSKRAQAEALLEAVQAKLWIEDPVGTEFIQGAHLTACTSKDEPCFHGGDCDDLTVLLAAACLSVGIDTLIVGHAYNGARQIAHVLCAVHIDGKWHYADASIYNGNGDHHPLGKCTPFVRETLHELPSSKLLCDQNQCLVAGVEYNPAQSSQFQINGGMFVGVRGAPDVPRPEDFAFRVRWLGDVTQSPDEQMLNYAQSVDPDKFYSDAKYREEFIENGAGKAAAIACVAYGAGAAAPLCDAAGKEIAKVAIKVFNAIFGGGSAAAKREEDRINKIAYYAGYNEAMLLDLLLRRWLRSTIAELATYRQDMGSPVLNGEVGVCPSTTVAFSAGGQTAVLPEHKCMSDERAIGYSMRKAGVPVEQLSGTTLYTPRFKWHGIIDAKVWKDLNASIGGGMPSLNKAMGSTATGTLGDIYDASYNLVIDTVYDSHTSAYPNQPNPSSSPWTQELSSWTPSKPWTKEAFLSHLKPQVKSFARSYAQQQTKAVAEHFTKSLKKFASEYVVEFAAKQAWIKANKHLVQKGSLKDPTGADRPKGMSTTTKVVTGTAAVAAIALVAYAYTSRTT